MKITTSFGTTKSPYRNDTDALAVYCRKTDFSMLRDRFGYLNQFSMFDIVDGNDVFPETSNTDTFSALMHKRALELLDLIKNSDRNLYIMWSGGVDSTAVVLSVLLNFPKSMYSRVKIVHTKFSIVEYTKFYEYMKTVKGLELIEIGAYALGKYCANIAETDYLITGFPADQLFGSIINQKDELHHTDDWRSFIPENKEAIKQFEAAFQHYNLPITQLGQFLWFCNFAFKWDFVVNFIPQYAGRNNNLCLPFFQPKYFQDWSVSNFDILHRYDQKDDEHYKIQIKEFIHANFPDDEYLRKGKLGSLGRSKFYEVESEPQMVIPFLSIIDGDGNLVVHEYYKKVNRYKAPIIREHLFNKYSQQYRKEK